MVSQPHPGHILFHNLDILKYNSSFRAGVGRTGTFLSLLFMDMQLYLGQLLTEFDAYYICEALREKRPGMIQTYVRFFT